MSLQTGRHSSGAMTFEEIGQVMGITSAHAFSIYKRAIRKIRRIYGIDAGEFLGFIERERSREVR
jgi:DNA-directed RNA polymerase sigma subunit (sigma70/sigma32)